MNVSYASLLCMVSFSLAAVAAALRIDRVKKLGFFTFWTSARCARRFLSCRRKAYLP